MSSVPSRPPAEAAAEPQTVPLPARIKTNRGTLTVTASGAIDGLWRLARKELMTGVEVRKLAGKVTRETLIRWRAGKGFPEPVLTFGRPGRGGALELWARSEVEVWLEARRREKLLRS